MYCMSKLKSLSLNIQAGVNPNLPNGGIYIRSLVPGGAAERDGRVHSGITAKCLLIMLRPYVLFQTDLIIVLDLYLFTVI